MDVIKKILKLPIFNHVGPAPEEGFATVFSPNLIAQDICANLYAYDTAREEIYTTDFKKIRDARRDSETSQRIVLKPKPDAEVASILLNPAGDVVALLSESTCYVAFLKSPTAGSRSMAPSEARTAKVGEELYPIGDRPAIVQAAWHPLSSSHLCVLTGDYCFRIYNVSRDLEDPEQEFNVALVPQAALDPGQGDLALEGAEQEDPVVAFWFGARRRWDTFAVYFLYQSGQIGALCPVLPYLSSRVPSAVLAEICDEIVRCMSGAPQDQDLDPDAGFGSSDRPSRTLRRQIQWLAEIAGYSQSEYDRLIESGTRGIQRLRDEFLRPDRIRRKNMMRFINEPDPGPEMYRTHPPSFASRALGRQALLQGPVQQLVLTHRLPSTGIDTENTYVSIRIMETEPPILVTATQEVGIINFFAAFFDLIPQWLEQPESPLPPPKLPAITLLEKVQLNFSNPSIELDAGTPSRVFVRHDSGVSEINLCWLATLEEFFSSDAALYSPMPDLVQSTVSTIVSTKLTNRSTPEPLIGFEIFTNPLVGHYLVGVTAASKPVVTSLSTAPKPLLLSTEFFRLTSSDASWILPTSFDKQVEAYLSPARQAERRIPILAPTEPRRPVSADKMFEQFQSGTSRAMQEYMADLIQLKDAISNRIPLLEQVEQLQEEELHRLADTVAKEERRSVRLRKATEAALKHQAEQCARAERLLRRFCDVKQLKSNADRDFERRVQSRKRLVDAFAARIQHLEAELAKYKQVADEPPLNDPRQLSKIKLVLEDENTLITSTVEQIKALELDVKSIRSPSRRVVSAYRSPLR